MNRLLRRQGLSVAALAREVGVSQPYLSRLLREADYKRTPSPRLAVAVAEAFGLPPDYFGEFREAVVFDYLRSHPAKRDAIFDSIIKQRAS